MPRFGRTKEGMRKKALHLSEQEKKKKRRKFLHGAVKSFIKSNLRIGKR
jgi:hypothetical protein